MTCGNGVPIILLMDPKLAGFSGHASLGLLVAAVTQSDRVPDY